MFQKRMESAAEAPLRQVSYRNSSSANDFVVTALDAGVDDEDLTASFKFPNGETVNQGHSLKKTKKRTQLTAFLVVVMGALAGASFLYIGISSANDDATSQFERRSIDVANQIDGAWKEYETAALWVHQSCVDWRLPNDTHCTRDGFERLYQYIISGGA